MKKTLLFSGLLVLILNFIQYAGAYQPPQRTFLADWADRTQVNTIENGTWSSTKAQTATPAPLPLPQTLPGDSSASTLTAADHLQNAGLKPEFAALYLTVQARTGTPWQLLAAVHTIETGQRGTTSITSYAGATGPMQFMPATFRAYGQDGDGDGTRTITDLEDAMLSAGHYLASNGAASGNHRQALYRYNHSWSYVDHVLTTARRLGL